MTDVRDRDGEDARTPDEDPRETMDLMKKMMSRCGEMMSRGAPPCCGTQDTEDETPDKPIPGG
jgi:hypothetical protein